MQGTFYGIGVGPGDPDLLTMKAIEVIHEADVIIAPKSEKKGDSTALTIATPHLKPGAEVLHMVFPMVYQPEALTGAWAENRRVLGELLDAGKNVAFLTLGDPMFYSTYIYVFLLLKDAGYPVKTVPGVPAFCAIASHVGYPLVEGDDVLSIVPATADEKTMEAIMKASNNVVLMKMSRNFDGIVDKLKENGLAENAIMVTKCGLADEQIVTDVTGVAAEDVNYLSTILTRRNLPCNHPHL